METGANNKTQQNPNISKLQEVNTSTASSVSESLYLSSKNKVENK